MDQTVSDEFCEKLKTMEDEEIEALFIKGDDMMEPPAYLSMLDVPVKALFSKNAEPLGNLIK